MLFIVITINHSAGLSLNRLKENKMHIKYVYYTGSVLYTGM